MGRLEAKGIGKRFHRNWVFKNVNLTLDQGERLLLTGSNGSGKSTLMRILAGQLSPTQGDISFYHQGKKVEPENWYRYLIWSGPYMDLYPDLTLAETIRMHFRFKNPLLPPAEIISRLNLQAHKDKELRHFSSGMLHRVKVGLAIFSHCELLLLDEATTNMDRENSDLVWALVQEFQEGRAMVWASNRESEFGWFELRLDL